MKHRKIVLQAEIIVPETVDTLAVVNTALDGIKAGIVGNSAVEAKEIRLKSVESFRDYE